MTVTVLDLRAPAGDRPARFAGRVLVVDDAAALIEHSAAYVDLMSDPMVGSVVCVAVGDAGAANPLDGVALTVPNTLRETTVLWVGDQRGVRWAPPGTPASDDRAGDGLADLISALRVDDVFDEVAGADDDRPRFVSSPAVRLTVGPADPADLAEAGAAALHALCVAETAPSRELVDEVGRIDAEHDPSRPQLAGQLAAAHDDARRRLHRVADLLRELGEFGGVRLLSGRDDLPSALVGTAIDRAGQAAENYRRVLGETLNRMDGHLQGGRPPVEEVMALGVADPLPARHTEIAAGLHGLVDRRLRNGVALPLLAQELRSAAAFTRPQGVTRLFDRVSRLGGLSLTAPAFRWWPAGLALLPAIVLSCAAMVALTGTGHTELGYAAGLVVLWWAAGWFLLARRPRVPSSSGERGFGPSAGAAATHLLSGVAGVALGLGLAGPGTGLPHVPKAWILFAGLAVLAVLLCALTWNRAVDRWRSAVPLTALQDTVATLDEITDLACKTEWQPMRRRRAVAAAAEAVAGGLESMARTLDTVGGHLFPPVTMARPRVAGPIARPGAQDLYAVVHADLAGLCEQALRPVWTAAASGRHADEGDTAQRLKHALDGYAAEVAREGLMGAPAATGAPGPRDDLAAMLAQSPAVADTLRIGSRDEMTQLCTGRQLSYLSSATEPSLVRFAPRQLRRVLGRGPRPPEDSTVVWTDHGEYAGALRLVPLRPESVRGEY